MYTTLHYIFCHVPYSLLFSIIFMYCFVIYFLFSVFCNIPFSSYHRVVAGDIALFFLWGEGGKLDFKSHNPTLMYRGRSVRDGPRGQEVRSSQRGQDVRSSQRIRPETREGFLTTWVSGHFKSWFFHRVALCWYIMLLFCSRWRYVHFPVVQHSYKGLLPGYRMPNHLRVEIFLPPRCCGPLHTQYRSKYQEFTKGLSYSVVPKFELDEGTGARGISYFVLSDIWTGLSRVHTMSVSP
jgi:hypothetical protein